jgi:tripartite ATP-independent transporter DctM subunit
MTLSPAVIGYIGIVGLLVLLALRMPVGIALIMVGGLGIASINGWAAAISTLSTEPFIIAGNVPLIIIPLFVLMGNLASISGMSRDLYESAYVWFGHRPGGLASATVSACAGFAALSGSSVASAVTMGRVALPEMKRFNYDPRLSTGCVAAGGTLGILIPPSTGFIVYAILTHTSVGKLFLAGILPGVLLATLFILTIVFLTRHNPELGPPGPVRGMAERIRSSVKAVPMFGIVLITIGGIYGGIFTVSEASGIGALLALLFAVYRRSLTLENLKTTLLNTVNTTAFVFLIVIGAHIFAPFLALSEIPQTLGATVANLELGRYWILAIILLGYVLLGTFLEGFAILVLTLPIVDPLIRTLGFDPIWFGVVMVIVLEMGLISPPVGVNVFVVKGIAPDVPMTKIFLGILPFWLAMIVCLALLVLLPEIATLLPNSMIEG